MNYKVIAGILILLSIITIAVVMSQSENRTDISKIDPPDSQEKESPVEVLPPPDPAEEVLASLSLEEKIGQLFILGFQESMDSDSLRSLIEEKKMGGFILFQRNYRNIDTLIQLNQQLHAWNKDNPVPLLISIDEEGGTVSRLPSGATKFPEARLLGNINEENLTFQVGEVIGKELSALGINLNFAPVMDVVSSKNNRLLYPRSYSGNPETVSRHGMRFIQGLQQQGVIGVPKHFPGHGDTQVDSHGGMPKIMVDRDTLLRRELVPFKASIEGGAEMIMAGHLAFPIIDEQSLPATRSRILLQELLRKELGFNGIIVTDDLEMKGYTDKNISIEEAALQSFDAGIDLFVICHTEDLQMRVYNSLKEKAADGTISEDRLNASVLRIIRLKQKYDLSHYMYEDPEKIKAKVGTEAHKKILQEVRNRGKSSPGS
ncbi:beta-N-acetylhexosaminidase [Geosporobacter ferrireducens]|uniref:beta-N-acetylhexosaminidase n=1 Tax=Geosporobacter ferrireducens TaxID=1424294 RepID=UPI002354146D|nr:beta-N-acetylhexosaminidase [Geosporobacter ferrireducens]